MLNFTNKNYFLIALIFFTAVYAYLDFGTRYNFQIVTVFLCIGLLSLYGLFLSIDKNSISLNKTFCLFFYFFFSIAPIIQYKNNTVFFVSRTISDASYIKTGLILLSILVLYLVLYHFLFSIFDKKMVKTDIERKTIDTTMFVNRLYLLSGMAISLYFYLIKFNWALLVFRPFVFKLKNNTNLGLMGYAILLIVQLIPFACLMYYKLRHPKNTQHIYFLLIMMMLVCFPTALSRGVLAIIYISVCLVFCSFLHRKDSYLKMYFLGLLIAFPLLNNFRYLYEGTFKFNYDLFNTAHFDAFQNFTFLLEEKLITNGRQLLGSIFFFVQESHWDHKPWGTGTLLAEKVGYSYTNVDMCFFGEGYANFGYCGIAVFLILITFFNAIMDYLYAKNQMSYLLKTIFYVFLGFEFYMLRGDLFSSFKIMTSFVLAISVVQMSCSFFNKKALKHS